MINRALGRQALLLVIVAVVVYMGAGFVHQIFVGREQREVLQGIESQIEVANQEQVALQAQLEYGQSPQAAEQWARENGWAQADEQLVIVVAPNADPAAGSGEIPAEPATPESIRDSWWDLFFADR